jgi:type I site-specific restriction endonuclease
MRISESATRAKLIDPLLTAAGWNLKDRMQVDFEIPVDGYDKEPWNGITDYCLFHPSGEVLAVVEMPNYCGGGDPRMLESRGARMLPLM